MCKVSCWMHSNDLPAMYTHVINIVGALKASCQVHSSQLSCMLKATCQIRRYVGSMGSGMLQITCHCRVQSKMKFGSTQDDLGCTQSQLSDALKVSDLSGMWVACQACSRSPVRCTQRWTLGLLKVTLGAHKASCQGCWRWPVTCTQRWTLGAFKASFRVRSGDLWEHSKRLVRSYSESWRVTGQDYIWLHLIRDSSSLLHSAINSESL